jgi:hypothetical protein
MDVFCPVMESQIENRGVKNQSIDNIVGAGTRNGYISRDNRELVAFCRTNHRDEPQGRTTGTNHRDWFESEYDVKLDEIEGLRTRAKQKAVKDWFKEKLPAVVKFLCFYVGHLGNLPLQAVERQRRRPARKSLSDLKFLMTYITDNVVAEGAWEEPPNHALKTVTAMHQTIVEQYLVVRDECLRHARRGLRMKLSDSLAHYVSGTGSTGSWWWRTRSRSWSWSRSWWRWSWCWSTGSRTRSGPREASTRSWTGGMWKIEITWT